MDKKDVLVFREYIGKQLLQRHKAIGLRYAREHRFPELIGPRSYGIIFKDNDEGQLFFRLSYDSKPLYDNRGRNNSGAEHQNDYGCLSDRDRRLFKGVGRG